MGNAEKAESYAAPAAGNIDRTPRDLAELKQLIRRKWPDAAGLASEKLNLTFSTGLPALDGLFPDRGIPSGQLIEITGGPSSGKTSLLFTLLAALTRNGRAVYIDLSRSFFPAAAAACGVDLRRFLAVTPNSTATALRVGELLLKHNVASWIVFDLVGRREMLPMIMLHRLRLKATRSRGLVFFLTEHNSATIPPSMVALRLEIERRTGTSLAVTVTRSRISAEGATVEVPLHAC